MSTDGSINDIYIVADRFLAFLWPVVGLCVFGMFIYGGFMWAIAGENPQNVQKARGIFTWAIIGACVAYLAVVLMNIFGNVLTGGAIDLTVLRLW